VRTSVCGVRRQRGHRDAVAAVRVDPDAVADPGVPSGVAAIGAEQARLAVDGGPVPVVIQPLRDVPAVIRPLAAGDATALYEVDFEFAPFVYDDGFYDCHRGRVPAAIAGATIRPRIASSTGPTLPPSEQQDDARVIDGGELERTAGSTGRSSSGAPVAAARRLKALGQAETTRSQRGGSHDMAWAPKAGGWRTRLTWECLESIVLFAPSARWLGARGRGSLGRRRAGDA
jgi:hypothetical protein